MRAATTLQNIYQTLYYTLVLYTFSMNIFFQRWLNATAIASYGLGFVALWFGIGEIIDPNSWLSYAPTFLGDGKLALSLVITHGIILSVAGLSVVFNMYRRIGAAILTLMLLEILTNLLIESGLGEIAVRDIGLLAMAISLVLQPKNKMDNRI